MSKKEKTIQDPTIKLTRVTSNPAKPTIENGVYTFKAEFSNQEVAVDGSPLHVYHTGYKAEIPAGYVGMLVPADLTATSSLITAVGPRLIKSGEAVDLFLGYKLTTNGYPAVFRAHEYGTEATKTEEAKPEIEGTEFCSLIVVPVASFFIDYLSDDMDKIDGDSEEEVAIEAEDAPAINIKKAIKDSVEEAKEMEAINKSDDTKVENIDTIDEDPQDDNEIHILKNYYPAEKGDTDDKPSEGDTVEVSEEKANK